MFDQKAPPLLPKVLSNKVWLLTRCHRFRVGISIDFNSTMYVGSTFTGSVRKPFIFVESNCILLFARSEQGFCSQSQWMSYSFCADSFYAYYFVIYVQKDRKIFLFAIPKADCDNSLIIHNLVRLHINQINGFSLYKIPKF